MKLTENSVTALTAAAIPTVAVFECRDGTKVHCPVLAYAVVISWVTGDDGEDEMEAEVILPVVAWADEVAHSRAVARDYGAILSHVYVVGLPGGCGGHDG